jgi:hypothetical protein
MGIFDRLRAKKPPPPGTVMVPEGHAVEVVKRSHRATFGQMASGMWVAEFAPEGPFLPLFDAVERQVRETEGPVNVIWIIGEQVAPALIAHPAALLAWLRRFHQLRLARGRDPAGDIAVVFALDTPDGRALTMLLRALDVGVHAPGPEGEVILEVHRPSGIVMGMAGPAHTGDAHGELRQVYLALAEMDEATAAGQELRLREQRIVELALQLASTRPPAPTPLSDLITRYQESSSPADYAAFVDVFMRSRVGVVTAGLLAGGGGPVQSTAAHPITVSGVRTPDGRTMLLACADRDAFVARFHGRFNAEVSGHELAAMALANPDCPGIVVNSAASFDSIVITRETLAARIGARS